MSVNDLSLILRGIGSAGKEEREAAEAHLEQEWMCRPSQLFPGLLQVIRTDTDAIVKSVAGVLLRKAVMRDALLPGSGEAAGKLWLQMDGPLQEQCRSALLDLFRMEVDSGVQHRLGDAVAEVARIQSEYGEWCELLALLFAAGNALAGDGASSVGEGLLHSLLRVLAAVPEAVEHRMAELDQVARLLEGCISQGSSRVRLESLRALSSLAYVLGEDSQGTKAVHRAFRGIVTASAQILASLGEEPEMQADAILTLADLAMTDAGLFKDAAGPLMGMVYGLVADVEGDEDVRKAGLELLLTMVESFKKVRKDRGAVDQIVRLLVQLVGEVEPDVQAWLARQPEEDDLCEGEMIAQYAEQGLDRLAMDLGGAVVLPGLMEILPGMLQSGRWQDQMAALRTIASIAEGCMDLLEDQLQPLLSLLWPAFTNPHPRVQHSACHALGQLCTDFDGAIQETSGQEALSALLSVLVGSGHARVQTHAAAALVNFAEGVEPSLLAPILDELMGRLIGLLQDPSSVVYLQSQLLATLASFGSAAGPSVQRYYSALIPLLLGYLSISCSPDDRPTRSLLCRALEAISIILYTLAEDPSIAQATIQQSHLDTLLHHMLLFTAQQESPDQEATDELPSFLATAWSRMCKVLGPERMAPLLPRLVPRLLARAAASPSMAALDMDDPAYDSYDQGDWQFTVVRGKRLGIHTATLDDKLEALQDLLLFVQALGPAYLSVAQETLAAIQPCLSFDLEPGVQAAAAELLADMLRSWHQASPPTAAPAIASTFRLLLESCWNPSDNLSWSTDYSQSALDAMADLLPILPADDSILPLIQSSLPHLLSHINASIQERLEEANGSSRQDGDSDEDDDEEYEEGMEECEEEEAVLYALSRFMAALLRLAGPAYAPSAPDLVAFCHATATSPKASPSMRHAAISILDDLIHWCGPASSQFAGAIAQSISANLSDPDADVRQASFYGLGMAAEHGGQAYHALLQAAIPAAIIPALTAPNARAPSQSAVTDNVVSATGRILCHAQHIPFPPSLLPAYLAAFPVLSDPEEIIPAYSSLLRLTQEGRIPADAARQAIQPLLAHPKDLLAADPALKSLLAQI